MTAYRQAKLRANEVANPMYMPAHDGERWNPRKVPALVNIRESAVVSLEARGKLDECQVKAAEIFRRHWEAMGGIGARAIGYTREPVDGGRNADPFPERRAAAGKELKRCPAASPASRVSLPFEPNGRYGCIVPNISVIGQAEHDRT